jgi:hypothetical protein
MMTEQLNQPQINKAHFLRLLTNHFNLGELKTLCFMLDIEFDNFHGESLSDKASELILYAERRDRLPDLLKTVKGQRPNIDWSTITTDIDQYRIIKPIGQGGMSSVYLAEDMNLQRHCPAQPSSNCSCLLRWAYTAGSALYCNAIY